MDWCYSKNYCYPYYFGCYYPIYSCYYPLYLLRLLHPDVHGNSGNYSGSLTVLQNVQPSRTLVAVGSILMVNGQAFGDKAGGARLRISGMAMPIEVLEWTPAGVKVRLPQVEITGGHACRNRSGPRRRQPGLEDANRPDSFARTAGPRPLSKPGLDPLPGNGEGFGRQGKRL